MHLVPPLVGFGVLTTNLVEGLMCLWELQDNTGSSPSLIRFTYRRWPLKCVKKLKTMVVCEAIHVEDYDMRRHWVKTMEREDCVVLLFPFLLCWVIGTTILLIGVPVNKVRVTEVMLKQNPMSLSEDNESKSYPELDESALLVAQVKLPCVFEIWPLEHEMGPRQVFQERQSIWGWEVSPGSRDRTFAVLRHESRKWLESC